MSVARVGANEVSMTQDDLHRSIVLPYWPSWIYHDAWQKSIFGWTVGEFSFKRLSEERPLSLVDFSLKRLTRYVTVVDASGKAIARFQAYDRMPLVTWLKVLLLYAKSGRTE